MRKKFSLRGFYYIGQSNCFTETTLANETKLKIEPNVVFRRTESKCSAAVETFIKKGALQIGTHLLKPSSEAKVSYKYLLLYRLLLSYDITKQAAYIFSYFIGLLGSVYLILF